MPAIPVTTGRSDDGVEAADALPEIGSQPSIAWRSAGGRSRWAYMSATWAVNVGNSRMNVASSVAERAQHDRQGLGGDHYHDRVDQEDRHPAGQAEPGHPLDRQIEEIGENKADDERTERGATEVEDREEDDRAGDHEAHAGGRRPMRRPPERPGGDGGWVVGRWGRLRRRRDGALDRGFRRGFEASAGAEPARRVTVPGRARRARPSLPQTTRRGPADRASRRTRTRAAARRPRRASAGGLTFSRGSARRRGRHRAAATTSPSGKRLLADCGLPVAMTDAGRYRFALAAPLPARTSGRRGTGRPLADRTRPGLAGPGRDSNGSCRQDTRSRRSRTSGRVPPRWRGASRRPTTA